MDSNWWAATPSVRGSYKVRGRLLDTAGSMEGIVDEIASLELSALTLHSNDHVTD